MSSVMAKTPTVTRQSDFMAAAEEGHNRRCHSRRRAPGRAQGGGRPPGSACRRTGRSRRRRRCAAARPARPGGSRDRGNRFSAAGGGSQGRDGASAGVWGGCLVTPGLAGPCSGHQVGRPLTRKEKNVPENNLGFVPAAAGTGEIFLSAVDGSASTRLQMQLASLKGFLENKQKNSYYSS